VPGVVARAPDRVPLTQRTRPRSTVVSRPTPLMIGSALVLIQIIVTFLLLRSPSGKFTAVAWVAGMTATRLAQGLVFGLVLHGPSR
jgi:hypothetical protein